MMGLLGVHGALGLETTLGFAFALEVGRTKPVSSEVDAVAVTVEVIAAVSTMGGGLA